MHITRRDAFKAGALGLAVTVTTPAHADSKVDSNFKISKGRIRQSVMGWCFKLGDKPMPGLELAKHCKAIGLEAMEGVSPEGYPAIRKMGLKPRQHAPWNFLGGRNTHLPFANLIVDRTNTTG